MGRISIANKKTAALQTCNQITPTSALSHHVPVLVFKLHAHRAPRILSSNFIPLAAVQTPHIQVTPLSSLTYPQLGAEADCRPAPLPCGGRPVQTGAAAAACAAPAAVPGAAWSCAGGPPESACSSAGQPPPQRCQSGPRNPDRSEPLPP